MSVIKIDTNKANRKIKRIKRWVGFWLLKDMPKMQITIRDGNFITNGITPAVEIKNSNPFVEATIAHCNFYPSTYEVVKKKVKKTFWQKARNRLFFKNSQD